MLEMPLNNVVVILVKFLILFDLDQVAFSLLFIIHRNYDIFSVQSFLRFERNIKMANIMISIHQVTFKKVSHTHFKLLFCMIFVFY